ncbi:type II toxin-antitoxin system RelE/ParE family toxin [Mucilaginibacter sp.]|uniref:type II toxin-antitoxin system RelE/ParE family toxin n=1 Tax=Mucilaginibacter sp. TaxID=1882438 RepID=UPI002C753B85|nr:type II toxin-antitoxin system RelE/ParE family toxin [Mucilaginibacter sp.]HTI60621.1 type II toxin-antitoxin system RelE/ParE family toxin [Mucilaginibacter sp.]
MDFEVIFHPEAEKEYLDACYWYERHTPGLGQRFKSAVSKQIERVVKNPEFYPVKKGNYRESNTEVFPYMIVYKISKRENAIYIAAIYHTSRKPSKKYRR